MNPCQWFCIGYMLLGFLLAAVLIVRAPTKPRSGAWDGPDVDDDLDRLR